MRRIQPNWPAPTWVRAITTTRHDGVSEGNFNSLNLGDHVNDDPIKVARNRFMLSQAYNFSHEPQWLNQSHSTKVFELKAPTKTIIDADGIWTQLTNVPCAILTADCLPILFCDTKGTLVAAIHAGWRGLAGGIIENTLNAIRLNADGEILAWLGPAISQAHFEVGEEVRDIFIKHDFACASAFKPGSHEGKWMGSLYQLATMRLHTMGVTAIYGGEYCTYTDAAQFYSYRRNKETGRMATLIWLDF